MMQRFGKIPQWVDSVWLVLLAIYVLAGTSFVPFHGDESTLVYMGRDYYFHFIEGDMEKILYDDTRSISPSEQELRLLNGTIPKYLYGWITSFNGYAMNQINEPWDWGNGYDYNNTTGHIPSDTLLIPARIVSAVQLALAIIIFFIIIRIVLNRPTAYVASLYLTLNPAILINGRRAMMEGSHLLFMMLVLLVGILLIRFRKWWMFILLGVVSGLALSAKHPNAIVVALVFIACGSYVILYGIRQSKLTLRPTMQFMGGLILSGVITLTVFYMTNPAWWGDPISRAATVLELRNNLLNIQIKYNDSYFTVSDQVNALINFAFEAQPQYFEVPVWAEYPQITSQIQVYEQSIWSGLAIGGSTIGGIILAILTIFGVFHFGRNKEIRPEYRWFILVWGLGIILITFIVTPLEWQRYYLPIYPFVGLMTAYSVITLSNIFWKRFKQ
jgi:4-amino-4-deoxy-L-arabinose transferase-like glycosyltransferase